jgi:hypothetical protein
MARHRHRPQKQKRSKVRQVQELRRSNAAGTHKDRSKYDRRDERLKRDSWCAGWNDVDFEETFEELGIDDYGSHYDL